MWRGSIGGLMGSSRSEGGEGVMDRAKPQDKPQEELLREMAARTRRLAEEAYRLAAEAQAHAAVAQRLVTRSRHEAHHGAAHLRTPADSADAAPDAGRGKRSRSTHKAGG